MDDGAGDGRTDLNAFITGELGRLLFEKTGDGIFIADTEGRFIGVNPRGMEMAGYAAEELMEMTIPDLFFSKSADQPALPLADFRQGKISGDPLYIRRGNDRFLPVILATGILPDGKQAGIVCELASRCEADIKLRESEEKYRQLIDTTDTGYVIVEENFQVVDANREYARLTGRREPEDVIGHSALEWIAPHEFERNAQETRKCLNQGFIRNFEIDYITPSGEFIPVEINASVLRSPESLRLLALCRNIKERRRVQAEKEDLRAQLLQAQKIESVGRLAGGVAHDFNNMLTAILGHTELAMSQCAPSDLMLTHLQTIEDSARRSTDLVRQLLAFARRQPVAPKVLDLNATVASMLGLLRRLIGEDIELTWMPGAGLGKVNIDPSQIDQVLANLTVNARDAIAGVGKISVETANVIFDESYCAHHSGFTPGEFVMIAVTDNGAGMNKEILDRVFEPFFTTKEAGRGTGLGLAMIYGIVKQNNGFVNVYSEPGIGTTMKIYLPRVNGEADPIRGELKMEVPGGRGETVLLVEDEAVILKLGKMMLERLGYRVLPANSPTEALRLGQDHTGRIKLLMTDVIMPEMNGRDLAKRLKDITPGIKCLFVSGYTANVIAHNSVLDEGVHFLQKPYSKMDLAVKVREVLGEE